MYEIRKTHIDEAQKEFDSGFRIFVSVWGLQAKLDKENLLM